MRRALHRRSGARAIMRERDAAAVALGGAALLAIPIVDVVLGCPFGGIHAVLGTTGVALLATTLLAPEA